jgi:hypothetical protein
LDAARDPVDSSVPVVVFLRDADRLCVLRWSWYALRADWVENGNVCLQREHFLVVVFVFERAFLLLDSGLEFELDGRKSESSSLVAEESLSESDEGGS